MLIQFGPLLQSFFTQESGWRGTQHSDLPEGLSICTDNSETLGHTVFFLSGGKMSLCYLLTLLLILSDNKLPSY